MHYELTGTGEPAYCYDSKQQQLKWRVPLADLYNLFKDFVSV